jgi:uncharacterized protein (DUF952 family)
VPELIHHLALVSDWESAEVVGEYRISTLGRTLDEEGFLHFCRTEEQLAGVAQRYYAHVTDPLCLLTVDVARLPIPVVDEPPAPGGDEQFPHVYGPLPVEAVVAVTPLGCDQDGGGVAAATVDAYRTVAG